MYQLSLAHASCLLKLVLSDNLRLLVWSGGEMTSVLQWVRMLIG